MNNTLFTFADSGIITVGRNDPLVQAPFLPAGTYVIEYSDIRGYYLRTTDSKQNPARLYGDVRKRSERVLNTYHARPGKNTGALLSGLRGTGKTILAREICASMIAQGNIVLVLQQPFSGPDFNNFITSITQPAVVMVDEFEKVYNDDDAQQALLTLMDGMEQDSKLWIMTVNDALIDHAMQNRPSRIFYHFEYDALPLDVVKEICADRGLEQDKTDQLVKHYRTFQEPTFDVILSLIEECKRYNEMPMDTVKMMNILAVDLDTNVNVEIRFIDSVTNKTLFAYDQEHFNPARAKSLSFDRDTASLRSDDFMKVAQRHVKFTPDMLVDPDSGETLTSTEFVDEHFYDVNRLDARFMGIDPSSGDYQYVSTSLPGLKIRVIPLTEPVFDAFSM